MINEWLVSEGIESIICDAVQESPPTELYCINIQKSILDTSKKLEVVLDGELEKLKLSIATSFAESSLLQNGCAISFIGKTHQGTIVRLFIDTKGRGFENHLNVEIITKNRSIFYHPLRQCLGYVSFLESGIENFQLFTDPSEIRQINSLPKLEHRLRLGILSLEHPHSEGNHLPSLMHMKDFVQVYSIYNANREQAKPWCDYFSAKYYQDLEGFLSDNELEVVLITSINALHFNYIKQIARHGKDIFCDKPIITQKKQLKEIVRICDEAGISFVTTYPVRLHPTILQVKQLVQSGKIGKLLAIMGTNHGCMYTPETPEWVKDPLQNGGGSIIDHTVHVADVIRFLTESEFETIRTLATSRIHNIPSEDISISHGTMSNGMLFQIDSSWTRKATDPVWGDVTFRVVGELGALWLDLYNNLHVEIFNNGAIEKRYPNGLLLQHGMIFYDYAQAKQQNQEMMNADLVDGIRTMELVFASYESLQAQDTVSVSRLEL